MPLTIVRALPGHESYLVKVAGEDILAQFPRRYAGREYKVGDATLAAVFWISGARVLLSQKSPQFIRRIVELALADLIRDGKVTVKKAAMLVGAGFAKAAIESQGGPDPIRECIPCLKEVKAYTGDTIILVRFSRDPKEYVINALAPAPAEKIKRVHYFSSINEAEVVVERESMGSFLGKRGANVATAAKLTGIPITIRPAAGTGEVKIN